jgi:hypothetical protein
MSNVGKNNNYKEILQDVAALCSERPEETEVSGLGKDLPKAQTQEVTKIHIRYSRAVKCRYKKQFQKENKGRAMQASTCPTKGVAGTSKAGEESQTKTVEHPRSDPKTPSPSADHQSKRTMVDDQRTYAQVTAGLVKVALVLLAYSNRQLDCKEVPLVKKLITGCIFDHFKGTRAPLFQRNSERDRAIIFNYVMNRLAND